MMDEIPEDAKSPIDVVVAHPDWLISAAAPSAESLFRLVAKDGIPRRILGWMVVTKCLHILRCVYGSDAETIEGLRKYIALKQKEIERIAKMLNQKQ